MSLFNAIMHSNCDFVVGTKKFTSHKGHRGVLRFILCKDKGDFIDFLCHLTVARLHCVAMIASFY